MKMRTWSVEELNRYINRFFKTDPLIQNIYIEGEISNCKIHASGHVYFSLKDENAKVNSIMFQSDVQEISIFEEGNHVVCQAAVNLYEREGSYNLIVKTIALQGQGALYLKFLERKEYLEKEGLFEEKHKKKLPALPKRVGVVTSASGAVIQDIINVTRNRFGKGEIILYPAKVQGEGAAAEIIQGILYFNSKKNVDVIIIGRGGGSYEELFCFNDEQLAREIFASEIPIVSAVGHETDTAISDFVADVRASTPSMAAEIVFPAIEQIYYRLYQNVERLKMEMKSSMKREQGKLNEQYFFLEQYSPKQKIEREKLRNRYCMKQMLVHAKSFFLQEEQKLNGMEQNLLALNPMEILQRGYALLRKEKKIISSIKEIEENEILEFLLKDGTIRARVLTVEKN